MSTPNALEGWLSIPGTDAVRPGPDVIRWRAVCLGAVGDYGELEDGSFHYEGNREALAELTEFARTKLAPHLTSWEKAVFGRTEFSEEDSYDAILALEPFGVLAWSVGAVDSVLSYDVGLNGHEVSDLAKSLRSARSLKLRSMEEVIGALREAKFWLARAQIKPLNDLDAVARLLADGTSDWLRPPPTIRNGDVLMMSDLSLSATPYHRLDEDALEAAEAIARLRHHALRWLAGEMGAWADYPTGRL